MSQIPEPKITFKHEAAGSLQKVTLYNATGATIAVQESKTFEGAMFQAQQSLKILIESTIAKREPVALRGIFKPCLSKGNGRLPIDGELWQKITMQDFVTGKLGLITQAEMARIRGVSRQAINQAAQRGDIEIFIWKNEKYIPFDTVAVSSKMQEFYGDVIVKFYSPSPKEKKPRRRTPKKESHEK